ncbi:hypothetical protein GIB67_039834 [Kingdonia uniflora]|uniref:Myb/SANT-like domain-containing protein n=1 Tax=Kingdonia uniflora TaxID=39325 RepID=A0A7J7P3J0_9MAGN|nr:hypothetical protein GIB67_039834 [Kingdonia uniflora]
MKKNNVKYENMNDDKEVMKNLHKKLRNIYTILKALLDQSRFGWDDEKHMVTADSYVWDEYLKKKRKLPETTLTAEDSKKGKRSTGEGMIDALKSIASAVDGMINRKSDSEKKPNVIEALDAISGLLEGDYLKACDLLDDEGKTRIFLNLAKNKRKMWLMWKINLKKDN